MKDYILYMDDTGFNAHEKDSKVLQNEVATYVGVLVEKKEDVELTGLMSDMVGLIKKELGAEEYHFTDIYNHRGPFKDFKFEEAKVILENFAELFRKYDLKIFIHTCQKEQSDAQKFIEYGIDQIASSLHLKKGPKTRALMLCYYKAKRYVVQDLKNSQINKIICDEGLRNAGATERLHDGTNLEFKSSVQCGLLQIADFAAWFTTRAKNTLDKVSVNKKISNEERAVLEIYSTLSDNYVGLSKVEINFDNLETFDYDETYKQCLEEREDE